MLRMQHRAHRKDDLSLKSNRELRIEQVRQSTRAADYLARLVGTSGVDKRQRR